MGRKSWLFCWTELGAKHVGIIQSLIVTCRLHGIDPYTYLVDVLQRVAEHPASRVAELTPRLWKQYFPATPLHSDLEHFSTRLIAAGLQVRFATSVSSAIAIAALIYR
jgi:hypothetical protein